MRAARAGLVALGVAVGTYGGWLLLRLGWDNLVATVPWLVAAVLLHDAVWAPLVLLLAALGGARLSRPWTMPVMVGAVVLVTVTLAVAPMLGRFGARPDNPTLLDRPYLQGWLAFAGLVLLGVAVGALVRGMLRDRRVRRARVVGRDPGADTPGAPG